MNEINRTGVGPAPARFVPVSAASSGGKTPQGGKALPPQPAPPVVDTREVREQAEAIQANVRAAVAQMNEYIQSTQRDLQFNYDPDSGQTVVKVLDRSTQEVIRQIPDEIFLRLAETLGANEPIQLFSTRV